MKIFKFLLLTVLFYACSTNDTVVTDPNGNNPDPNNDNTGKQLITAKAGDRVRTYQYNNNATLNAIKEEVNGELSSESEFVYENGKITEITWKDARNNTEVKRVYEYNGDLLVKETFIEKNETVAINEFYYDANNRMNRQIQKLEWNVEENKQTRTIDIEKVAAKNEIQVKYNNTLAFVVTYDNKETPYAKINGYSTIHATQFYGISNNILNFKRVNKNGSEIAEVHDLQFDATGEYLLEDIKRINNGSLIIRETYTYN